MNKRPSSSVLLEQFQADQHLRCVFSRSKTVKLGTGTTSRKQESKEYYYIQQTGWDTFEVRKINENFVPDGDKEILGKEEVLSGYTPEMELYTTKVRPAIASLNATLGRADRYRTQGKTFSAELEYNNALKVERKCVRAVFGLGLVYLARNETDKAENVFQSLVQMDGAFDSEYKHLFNEFGIALRKSGLYEEALAYYSRALDFAPGDEHLFFNLSRACFELGDMAKCLRFLARSIQLRKGFAEGLQFCRFLLTLANDETLRAKYKLASPESFFAGDAGFVIHCLERVVDPSSEERHTGLDQLLGYLAEE